MPPNNHDSSWRILKLEEDCERHERDLYRGNGLPGLTTRMKAVEDALGSIKYYFRAIVVLLIGLMAHALWDIVTKAK